MPNTSPHRSPGWRPKQHGAWFMLALPIVVGLMDRPAAERFTPALIPLIGCWVLGYLAFNAATIWLKAPPARRRRHAAPVVAYGILSLALGLAALAFAGPSLLGWGLAFAPLVAGALWLAAKRQDRTLASGILTVVAASLMTPVVRYLAPSAFLESLGTPAGNRTLALTALVCCYLLGTVFYVKTMIRERGETSWLVASVGWHLAATALAIGLAATGLVGWSWAVFFAATVVRAWLVPHLGRTRTIRPLAVGLVEIGFTIAFCVAVALG